MFANVRSLEWIEVVQTVLLNELQMCLIFIEYARWAHTSNEKMKKTTWRFVEAQFVICKILAKQITDVFVYVVSVIHNCGFHTFKLSMRNIMVFKSVKMWSERSCVCLFSDLTPSNSLQRALVSAIILFSSINRIAFNFMHFKCIPYDIDRIILREEKGACKINQPTNMRTHTILKPFFQI